MRRLSALWLQVLGCAALAGVHQGDGLSLELTKYATDKTDVGAYYAEVSIGTPAQGLRLKIDTGACLLRRCMPTRTCRH